jgi:hypothetical protein
MGMIQADLLVRDVMSEGFGSLLTDPSPIRDVFDGRPQDEVATILDWFAANRVKIDLGYPRNATELPGLYISLMTSTEARQLIGGEFPDGLDDPNPDSQSEYSGSFFNTGVRVACWSINADLTVWLQNLAQSFLIGAKQRLNGEGLHEQSITVADFGPLPQWFPDFAFRRDVSLTALHPATAKQTFPKIKEVDVTATAAFTDETVRATLRMIK